MRVHFLPYCALCTGAAFVHSGTDVDKLDWGLCSRCTGIYRATPAPRFFRPGFEHLLLWVPCSSEDMACYVDGMKQPDRAVLLAGLEHWHAMLLVRNQPLGQA